MLLAALGGRDCFPLYSSQFASLSVPFFFFFVFDPHHHHSLLARQGGGGSGGAGACDYFTI